jgi:YD repeat-containing protein
VVEYLVIDYERDKLGRIVKKTESIEGETVEYVYEYDPLGRLVSESRNGALAATWSYDGNGTALMKTI